MENREDVRKEKKPTYIHARREIIISMQLQSIRSYLLRNESRGAATRKYFEVVNKL